MSNKKKLTDLENRLVKAGTEFDNVMSECIIALFDKAVKKNNAYVYNYSKLDEEVARYIGLAPEESYLCDEDSDEIRWDILIDKKLKIIVFTEHQEEEDSEYEKGTMLENYYGEDGQVYVDLEKDDTVKKAPVAYLVASTFIENPNGYKYIRHKDGDRSNNKADNLEWCETEEEYFESTEWK